MSAFTTGSKHSFKCPPNCDTDHDWSVTRPDALSNRTVTITTEQAKAAVVAIGHFISAMHYEDSDTWHGGLGADGCEFCNVLVVLRHAAGYEAIDHLRP